MGLTLELWILYLSEKKDFLVIIFVFVRVAYLQFGFNGLASLP